MKHLPWISAILFGALSLRLCKNQVIFPDPVMNGLAGGAIAVGACLLGWLIGYGLRMVYQQIRGRQ
jgi:hypothetical protein